MLEAFLKALTLAKRDYKILKLKGGLRGGANHKHALHLYLLVFLFS
ncbi:hypothetical protein HBZS_107100 [Helicobacter bizzozeronii CCUG 35545]|nr:hypothetical protein HBZS_107100 [Helicobacter bizzozeronii CCUG 35545]